MTDDLGDRMNCYVKLNVGGTLFYTTIGTLLRGNTMLNAMFSGRMEVKTDSEGKDFGLVFPSVHKWESLF